MNNTRTKRIQLVVDVVNHREQEAAKQLNQAKQTLSKHQNQLVELERYREEYATRFQESAKRGLPITQLREYLGFIDKIHQAVQFQQHQIEVSQKGVNFQTKEWLKARTRRQGVEKLQGNYKALELRIEEQRAQKENDEFAQRAYLKK